VSGSVSASVSGGAVSWTSPLCSSSPCSPPPSLSPPSVDALAEIIIEDSIRERVSGNTDNDPDDIKLKNTARLKTVNKTFLLWLSDKRHK
jgi:hypothetical protein